MDITEPWKKIMGAYWLVTNNIIASILILKVSSHTQLGAMPSRPCNLTFITSTPQIISVTAQKRANKQLNEIEPRYKNNLTRSLLEIYNNPKNILGRWVRQVRQQKQLNPETPCDLKTPPHTRAHTPSHV